MAHTDIPETTLMALRAAGRARQSQSSVLDRRGEEWDASVLGRDLSRRSIAVRSRPFLHGGEEYTLVAADQAEDGLILARLDLRG